MSDEKISEEKNEVAETPAAPKLDPTDDSAVFLEGGRPITVRTIHGKVVPIPPIPFGREQIILKKFGSTIGMLAKSGIFGGNMDKEQAGAEVISLLFGETPDAIAEIVAAICDQPVEWVQEELDSELILGIILPFLQHKQTRIVAAVSRHVGSLENAVQTVAALVPKRAA